MIKYEGKQKAINTYFIIGDQRDAQRGLQDTAKVLLLKLSDGWRVIPFLIIIKLTNILHTPSYIYFIIHILFL